MIDLQTKFKRQIEILGLCIANKNGEALKIIDLADFFNVEELTIKRDLQELRSYGIDIHSEKKKGICLFSPIEGDKLKSLMLQYLGLCHTNNTFDKSTGLMIKKLKENALGNVVTLQRCIDLSLVAFIDYQKEEGDIEKNREIHPLRLFRSENYWRILAINDGKIKQYHLNKLISVKATDKKFKRIPDKQIDELFQFSWKSWIGSEKHNIKLCIAKEWAKVLIPKQLMEHQTRMQCDDGSVIFETVVNSLQEVAAWVLSFGGGVKVIEPKELKERVVKLAEGVLGNYKNLDK